MAERIFLVHGWSVRSTDTYAGLHTWLSESSRVNRLQFDIHNIFLGRYISLEDQVEIADIAKAMHSALQTLLRGDWTTPFHLITHSTGALVVKYWIVNFYKGSNSSRQPLKNVVFLAGPHFGSRLAHHGRSMLSQVMERGDTGKRILTSLELGSQFSWDINEALFDRSNWEGKGIRFYNLIGDRIDQGLMTKAVFPAAAEEGSDEVVRCAAANLNFKRFRMTGKSGNFQKINEISGVAFGAFHEFTHSGKNGIMYSIQPNIDPVKHRAFLWIFNCLLVKTDAQYNDIRRGLANLTGQIRKLQRPKQREFRQGYAQLDFRFTDDLGKPVGDYVIKIGAVVNGKELPSKTVAHTHKNVANPNHFTVFINLKELEPQYGYFIDFNSDSNSNLFSYYPDPLKISAQSRQITDIIVEDQTTQIDVVLSREVSRNLFVFHPGNDLRLPVTWNRDGEIK